MYVYLPADTADAKHIVGFYAPPTYSGLTYSGVIPGPFVVESEWECREDAARRVHFLNGGGMYDGKSLERGIEEMLTKCGKG